MNKLPKTFLLFFIFLIFTSFSFASDLTCQYTEEIVTGEETFMQPYSRATGEEIKDIEVILQGNQWKPAKVINPNEVDLNLRVDLEYFCYKYSKDQQYRDIIFNVFVASKSSFDIEYPDSCPRPTSGFTNFNKVEYIDNNFVYTAPKTIDKREVICKECGGKSCLDDGIICSSNSECGSGSCILGVCSNNEKCFGSPANCNCDLNTEFQYDDSMCIKNHSVINGGKPISDNPLECISEFIDKGVCKVKTGNNCNSNEECASGSCMRGICSAAGICYNDDCKCSSDEFQYQNKTCIKLNSVKLAVKPSTDDSQECITGYIDSKSGTCSLKSGELCNINSECGSALCLGNVKRCNIIDTNTCYNNDCECDSNQFQYNNQKCYLVGKMETGFKPESGDPRECSTGYINDDGLCAHTLGYFLGWWLGIIAFIVIIALFVYFKFKGKINDGDIKRISLELELLKERQQDFNLEEEKLKKLQSIKNKTEIQKKEIKQMNKEINIEREKLKNNKKRLEEERLTPYKNKQGHLVHLNEDGYEIFDDSKKIYHRWWYEKRSKTIIPKGYEIHHRDGVRTNNNIKNLQLVTKEEHDKIHKRGKFKNSFRN
jgi:hypothetical protein